MPLFQFTIPGLRLSAMFALVVCATAHAQTDAALTLERQSDAAFQQVLQQPQNLGLWSTYADLLIKQGNYEGGIAALERLLLEPNASPELRVDVAVLYFRLASYAQAGNMLRQALEDKRLQGGKRDLANALLVEIAKRLQISQLSGAVTFGLRQQSNALFRTDSAQVIVNGAAVPYAQKPEANTDATLGFRVRHLYDLDRQNSASIVSNFGAYLVNYSSSAGSQITANPTKPYDLLALDLSTGLQFKPLPSDLQNLTLRPHILWSRRGVRRDMAAQ
jgi:tetratricopeptide (TPR) repeat protein